MEMKIFVRAVPCHVLSFQAVDPKYFQGLPGGFPSLSFDSSPPLLATTGLEFQWTHQSLDSAEPGISWSKSGHHLIRCGDRTAVRAGVDDPILTSAHLQALHSHHSYHCTAPHSKALNSSE
ncbi:MAG: hypothetical protein CL912_01930 [Deltaproteobacteria bacterium]|nr:hypothetical protein [Deltaproteobacteria bacterium]